MKNLTQQPDLSIVIPAYLEEKRIGQTMDKLAKYLNTNSFARGKNIEVIIVSADSPDNTHKIIEEKKSLFSELVILKPGSRAGKGRDVKYGILKARGKAVVFMDADLSTPLSYIEKFYETYEHGSEVVIATRSMRTYRGTATRSFLSFMGNVAFRLTGGLWVEDSQCGFKLFSAHAAKLCFSKLRIKGWGFDMEVLSIARSNGLKITPIRVNDWQHVNGGPFEDMVVKNAFRSLYDLFLIFSRRARGAYIESEPSVAKEKA